MSTALYPNNAVALDNNPVPWVIHSSTLYPQTAAHYTQRPSGIFVHHVPLWPILTHEEGSKVARPPVHLHGAGVAHGDEEAVRRLQEGSTGLMQGEEPRLLAPRPAHAPGGLHEQDGHRVGAHL